MAGKILPIALATIAGISIGVATFDGEFKRQQKERLDHEYKEAVAAAAIPANAATEKNAIPSIEPHSSPGSEKASEPTATGLTSLFSLSAWRTGKQNTPPSADAPSKPSQ